MAIVKIEGKEIPLPDDVVNAGDKAIRAVLAASGFPAVENADIQIKGRERAGAPAIVSVTPRSTGKGAPSEQEYGFFLDALLAAPQYVNPAIALAAECIRAEAQGDSEFLERAARGGAVERAVMEGSREGKAVLGALSALGHAVPCASKRVPDGF
jgi:hypothetical protein